MLSDIAESIKNMIVLRENHFHADIENLLLKKGKNGKILHGSLRSTAKELESQIDLLIGMYKFLDTAYSRTVECDSYNNNLRRVL